MKLLLLSMLKNVSAAVITKFGRTNTPVDFFIVYLLLVTVINPITECGYKLYCFYAIGRGN